MEIIKITESNIDTEHICCAISEKKGENCVKLKKNWMRERLREGLIFKKLDVRGKAFIEYISAENAWAPFNAVGYMVINCFWVSGQYKGKGISNLLLEECIKDSKNQGKKGIVVLSSKKKKPYLSDGDYLKYKGFKVADTAEPHYELLYLQFKENEEELPTIKECAKKGQIEEKGLVLNYSNQCPHTEKYVNIIKDIADSRGIELKVNEYNNKFKAQNSPSPFTTYSFFYDGKFVTNEILSEKRFIKILDECIKV